MSRIAWVEDADAQGQLADLFNSARAMSQAIGLPPSVPDIYRTMSQRPDFLAAVMEAEGRLHFADGALTRAQHEMIASYVSALTRCHD
jgi:hypothetical protein